MVRHRAHFTFHAGLCVCVCVCVFSGFADFVSMILAILLHVNIMGFKQTGLVLGAPRQEIRGLVIGR